MEVKAKEPKVRFGEFTGKWEECRFNEIYKKINEKNDLSFGPDKIISVANMYYKPMRDSTKSKIDYMKTYNIMRVGDIAFEGNKSKSYSYGRFVENIIGDGIVSHVFDVFRPITSYDLFFWKYYINNENIMGHILRRVTTKATMMTNLVAKDFLKAKIYVPSIDEQKRIGLFLKQIDSIITLHQQELEKLKESKKTLLSKMFPKEGADRPEIRFAGFTDPWEQRKLKDFTIKTGKKNSEGEDYPAYSVSNKLGLVSQTKQFDGSRLDFLDKTAYKFVNQGEFAYNPARINVGSIAFNDLGKTVIVSSLYVVLKISDKLDNEYILQFIKSIKFIEEVKRNTEGSVREYLFFDNFKNIKFPYIKNLEEQQKIGSFFKQLDNTITLHQKELENLKELKKTLLNLMFV